MNIVILVGWVGNDPEIYHFENGGKIAKFSLATKEKYKNFIGEIEEKTIWHKIIAGGRLTDLCENYVRKGSLLSIQGKIDYRNYKKDGNTFNIMEIKSSKLEFLFSKREKEDNQEKVEEDDFTFEEFEENDITILNDKDYDNK